MATGPSIGDELRETAEHRGLKLVKSRRRKPGTGDYGKFGLTDLAGKPLLGVSENGLTATAEEIEAYLRSSAAGSWQQSADSTPDPPKQKSAAVRPVDDDAGEQAAKAVADRRPRMGNRSTPTPSSKPASRKVKGPARDKRAPAKPAPEAQPSPQATLAIRRAEISDAAALAILISQLRGLTVSAKDVAADLKTAAAGQGGVLLAELGEAVGCCAWRKVPTLHRGAIGRITLLVVDKAHRRRGIGTKLMEAAMASLGKSGCSMVEAMSDIDIVNAHNFFRSNGFRQASYRFTRGE